MRIGDLVILERTSPVVVAEKRERARTGERGSSGLYTLGNVLSLGDEIDYLAAMRPPDRWANVDKMLSDPSVWAAFMAWVLPILSTARDVQPGGTAPEDDAIADFIREDLQSTSTTMQQIRYEELLSVAYGVTIHSKVWEYREDGLVHLRNLAYRPPSSVKENGWLIDDGGGPEGVVQWGQPGGDVTLPIDEILMHIHFRVGGNITGRSGLRAAYKPWWYKDKIEGIAAVAVERGQGIPVGTQTGDDDKVSNYITKVLKGLRTHELSYVKEIEGKFKFRMEGRSGEVVDPLPLLQYHAIEVFRSVLAQHVALGGTDVGSWALAKGDIDFLVMALGAVMKRIEDTYNQHLIPQWVRYNWANVPRNAMPKVVHSPLNTRNVKDWFGALVPAVAGNVVDPDDQVKAMAREMLGVPEPVVDKPPPRTEDELESEKPAEEGEQGSVQGQWRGVEFAALPRMGRDVISERFWIMVRKGEDDDACWIWQGAKDERGHGAFKVDGRVEHAHRVAWMLKHGAVPRGKQVLHSCDNNACVRHLRLGTHKENMRDRRGEERTVAAAAPDRLESEVKLEALGVEVNFAAMAQGLDKAEAGMVGAAKKVQAKQIKNLITRGREVVARGDPALVAETDVRFVDELEQAVADEMQALYELGVGELDQELRQQDVKPDKPEKGRTDGDRDMLLAMAVVMAAELADRLMRSWSGEVLRQLRVGGGFNREALGGLLDGLADSTIEQAARLRSAPALNMGRAAVVQANVALIEKEIYSAVMDSRTCPRCRDEDGKEYPPGEGTPAPNPSCLGLDKCRCVRVPWVLGR